jgi:site-specific recombinase XerD
MSALLEHEVDLCPHRAVLGVMNISYATDLWLGELERKGHRRRTVDTYRRLLDRLAAQHQPHVDVRDITSVDVRRFLDLTSQRENGGGRKSAASIAQDVSTINGFFDWIAFEGIIEHNPTRRNGQRILCRPRQPDPIENDNVVTVSGDEVRRLLAEAERGGIWRERLCLNVLVYLGPRRNALAQARIRDYDQVERTLTFWEKGAKTIGKDVPHKLGQLLDEAIYAGVYSGPDDYLIPSVADQRRQGERDNRIIYHLVKRVAYRAGVKTHVHALRAAFAVYFLENNPGESVGLQELMGHKRPETTNVYLRRLDRRKRMASVRTLDWDADFPANTEGFIEALRGTEKEGFEPSKSVLPLLKRDGSHPQGDAPRERLH